MRDQGAFGRARGAAGVDQHGAFVCPGLRGGILGGHQGAFKRIVHLRLVRRLAHTDQAAHITAVFAHLDDIAHTAFVANRHYRAAVGQTVFQRIGAKEHRQRHRHRPHLQHRHISHRRFKALGHDNGHAVTAHNTQARQHVAKLAGLLTKCFVTQRFIVFLA